MGRAHPIYSLFYAGVAALGERTGYGKRRDEALAGAHGRLLIVGLGPGHDLDHLPAGVRDVVAVEPSRSMRDKAVHRVGRSGVPTWLVGAAAEALPLREDSVDTALVALVFCSIDDPARACAELLRVLRPGGTLHVLEHVHAAPGSRLQVWQDRLDPVWSRLSAGCHVTRDTRQILSTAGFDTAALRDITIPVSPALVAPHLIGQCRAEAPHLSEQELPLGVSSDERVRRGGEDDRGVRDEHPEADPR
ncbi:MAG: class I SAM-dependent methyltransferase [Nocardioidaceae bacterium]